jgi:hypothetical protein
LRESTWRIICADITAKLPRILPESRLQCGRRRSAVTLRPGLTTRGE